MTLTVSDKTKGGGIITADFVTVEDNTATVESVDSSVLDTPMVNGDPQQSKYGCTYRRTTHYDPTAGHTIGTEVTVLTNYYQCLEDTDGKMEFANVGAGIGGGFENTMELKLIKYDEAINGPDGKAWKKEIENEHDRMAKTNAWNQRRRARCPKVQKS